MPPETKKDRYWDGFADGAEFVNRLYFETDLDEMGLHAIIEEHINRIRNNKKGVLIEGGGS